MKKQFVKLTVFLFVAVIFTTLFYGCNQSDENSDIKFAENSRTLFIGAVTSVWVINSKSKSIDYSTDKPEIIDLTNNGNSAALKAKATGTAIVFAKIKGEVKAQMTIIVEPDKPEHDGGGTLQNPYLLYNYEQLSAMQAVENGYAGKHFKLMKDISIGDEWRGTAYNGAPVPIYNFKGHFDGNGRTVEFLQGRGFLFGDNEGTIRNLKVKGQGVGAFITANNYGEISNCLVEGNINILSMFNQFGAIANFNTGTIKNCVSKVNITANEHTYAIGGICGVFESGIIENCLFLGTITVNTAFNNGGSVGALIGQRYMEEAVLKNLYYDASIIGQNNSKTDYFYPGGAVGCHKIGDTELSETENVTNVTGISDWQSVDFSDFDSAYWDLSQAVPRLKAFL